MRFYSLIAFIVSLFLIYPVETVSAKRFSFEDAFRVKPKRASVKKAPVQKKKNIANAKKKAAIVKRKPAIGKNQANAAKKAAPAKKPVDAKNKAKLKAKAKAQADLAKNKAPKKSPNPYDAYYGPNWKGNFILAKGTRVARDPNGIELTQNGVRVRSKKAISYDGFELRMNMTLTQFIQALNKRSRIAFIRLTR